MIKYVFFLEPSHMEVRAGAQTYNASSVDSDFRMRSLRTLENHFFCFFLF